MSRMVNLCAGVAMVLVLGLGANAQAVPITGEISIDGRLASVTGSTAAIRGANFQALTFLDFVSARTNGPGTGDFAGVADNTVVTMTDFSFNPFTGPQLVWTIPGVFNFTLNSLTIEGHDTTHIDLIGTGVMTGAGFDATPYDWGFSATRTSTGTNVSFTLDNATVPEPTSILLLGSGLLGLGLWGRKRMQA
jgi:PEP-CTERM motif